MATDIAPRISVDPAIRGGKPVVKGTRVAVEDVLELVAGGITIDLILKDYYAHLTREDVLACVRYAADLVKGEEVHLAKPPST